MIKKVMVFGTFDILHPGHLSYFKQAKKWGDYLMVVVARDKTVLKVKKRKTKFSEKIRLREIKKLKIVDKVVLGDLKDKFKVIKKEKPEIVCFGYDQKVTKSLLGKIKKLGIKTKRAKAFKPRKFKSSLLRKNVGP